MRLRRTEGVVLPAGEDQVVFVHADGRQLLARSDARLLDACTRFASLDEHADALARAPGAPPGTRKLVRRKLEALAAQGLFDRSDRLLPADPTAPCRLSFVGIPTMNRPESVLRAVRSVDAAARSIGRKLPCLVLHDSPDPAVVAAASDTLAPFGAIVVDREGKGRIAEDLARAAGVPAELARWGLLGDPTQHWRVGGSYTAALLFGAGRTYLSIDDDVVLRLAASPDQEPGARATSWHDPTSFTFFDNREAARAHPLSDRNAIEVVEEVLGRSAADVLGDVTDATWLDDVVPSTIRPLARGRVAATSFGALGDSGMGNTRYWIFLRGRSRDRATVDEATWNKVKTTRSVLRATERIMLSSGIHFMTMGVGLDHRDLLPPFVPAGRGSDESWVIALRRLREEALVAHLPWGVVHEPPEVRPSSGTPGGTRFLDALNWALQSRLAPASASRADRLRSAVAVLDEIGRASEPAFEEFMRHWHARRVTDEIRRLEEQIEEVHNAAFQADLRADITALRARLVAGGAPTKEMPGGWPAA